MLLKTALPTCLLLAATMGATQMEPVTTVDFETGAVDELVAGSAGLRPTITADPAERVAGERSLKGDSTGGGRWNEFYHSPDGLLEPHRAYAISFDYKVLSREGDARFYCLVRSRSGKGRGNYHWQDWQGEPGDTGRIELAPTTGAIDDYALIIGIRDRGSLAIDSITFSSGTIAQTRLPDPERTRKSPGDTTYYIDSSDGDDADPGTSKAEAWQTLGAVNATEFAPGDRILFRAGGEWTGCLAPGGSGKEGAPITVGAYGEGPRPRVDGRDEDRTAVYLLNQEYWELSDLEVTNQGSVPGAQRIGVLVRVENYGTAHHIHLTDLHVHDVNGSNVKGGDQAGIVWQNGGDEVKSRFDGLLIESCHLVRCDRNAIVGRSGHWARKDWFPSLNVVIRGNLLEDTGGDAIVPIGCDGCLVERNTVRGARQRAQDAAAGIWPWSCDNTVVQFNDVSGVKGTHDGQGFDSDWNCRNTLIQYNYSHDNDGGFLLVCNNGGSAPDWNIGNIGTVARYNISVNDGARLFHIGGPCEDTLIHNNTFYVPEERDILGVWSTNWGGWANDTRFVNNLFRVEGKARFDLGESTANRFHHNVFFGDLENAPENSAGLTSDPMLTAPGSGGEDRDALGGYQLRPGSPCLGAGEMVPENGGQDFWGNPVPGDAPPDIGAHQLPRE